MILVCPSCDAKFKIPDGAIPAEGRTVRCAKCKNSWHAKPNDIMRKQARPAAPRPAARPAPAPQSVPQKPVAAHENFDGQVDEKAAAEAEALRRSVRTVAPEPEIPSPISPPMSSVDDDLFDDGDSDAPPVSSSSDDGDDFGISAAARAALGDDFMDDGTDPDGPDAEDLDDYDDEDYDEDDFLARRRADQRRQSERDASDRRQRLVTVGWAGLVVFWAITFYVLVIDQENMKHYFPGASSFIYSTAEGMSSKELYRPEEGEKLTPSPAEAEVYISAKLDNTRTRVEQVDGKNLLMVRGFVENLGTTGASVPQVLVEIVDANNRVLDQWITEPAGLIIRRGGRVNFVSSRDVPVGIASVRVSVIEGSKSSTSGEFPS